MIEFIADIAIALFTTKAPGARGDRARISRATALGYVALVFLAVAIVSLFLRNR